MKEHGIEDEVDEVEGNGATNVKQYPVASALLRNLPSSPKA